MQKMEEEKDKEINELKEKLVEKEGIIKKFEEFMDRKLDEAIERGKDPAVRQDALRDMYIDHQ